MFSEFQVSMPSVLTADHRELLRVPVCVVSVRYLPEEGRSGGETEAELEKKKENLGIIPKHHVLISRFVSVTLELYAQKTCQNCDCRHVMPSTRTLVAFQMVRLIGRPRRLLPSRFSSIHTWPFPSNSAFPWPRSAMPVPPNFQPVCKLAYSTGKVLLIQYWRLSALQTHFP